MKKIISIFVIFLLVAQVRSEVVTFSRVLNENIPDNDPIGIQSTHTLSGYTGVIESVQVRLVIAATNSGAWNGDYFVSLLHESGYAVLLNRAGLTATESLGYGDNGFDVTFTDAGQDNHLYQTFTYNLDLNGALTGATWGVDGRATDPLNVLDTDARTAMLSSFIGLTPNGDWTLFAADNNFNGDGTLVSWGVVANVIPEPASVIMIGLGSLLIVGYRRFFGRI